MPSLDRFIWICYALQGKELRETGGNLMRKPHLIVADWRGHPNIDFGAVAKRAAALVQGGISTEEDVRQAITEEFGAPPVQETLRNECAPLAIFGGEHIEQAAIEQMQAALRLPVALRGALAPDAHPGYALPIGGIVTLQQALSPAFVGYDIGCRMMLSTYQLSQQEVRADRTRLLDVIERLTFFGKGVGQDGTCNHPILDDSRWQETSFLRGLRGLAQQHLGTSGSGNHFVELVFGVWHDGREFVGLLTHSGSRGVGHKIATRYMKLAEEQTARIARDIPTGYGWLSLASEAGQEYLHAMNLAGDFASANHHCIHQRFAAAIGAVPVETIENHHNFAWVQADESVIHRKGATPAEAGVLGIIPGSMATASFIVRGRGNNESLQSASHGAGRVGSRAQARRDADPAAVARQLQEADVDVRGLSMDENPLAYKDIHRVVAAQRDLIDVLATMHPVAVVMAGDDAPED